MTSEQQRLGQSVRVDISTPLTRDGHDAGSLLHRHNEVPSALTVCRGVTTDCCDASNWIALNSAGARRWFPEGGWTFTLSLVHNGGPALPSPDVLRPPSSANAEPGGRKAQLAMLWPTGLSHDPDDPTATTSDARSGSPGGRSISRPPEPGESAAACDAAACSTSHSA